MRYTQQSARIVVQCPTGDMSHNIKFCNSKNAMMNLPNAAVSQMQIITFALMYLMLLKGNSITEK